ncbi:MAG: nucleotidyltransferase domain-containing protein [Firmicutes bacterium]|nr:nucleotidyltransferase domain-containing protein [Bacillota bacterium]
MRTGINPKVIKEIRELAQRHEIQKVLLFGSRARGDFERASDIDLAVTGGDYFQFALDVEEETSTLLMYDIVNLDGAVNEELRQSIQREGIVVYEKI